MAELTTRRVMVITLVLVTILPFLDLYQELKHSNPYYYQGFVNLHREFCHAHDYSDEELRLGVQVRIIEFRMPSRPVKSLQRPY